MDRREFVCGCFALLLAACAQAPVTGRQQLILVSEDQMDQAGAQAYRQVISKEGVSQNQDLQRRVETVGSRIARASGIANADWEFTVINDQTPNAFALPGGKVGVNVGLFKVVQNDDQLAAVLGHEIGHVGARHPAERVSQQIIEQGGLQALGVVTQSQAVVQLATAAALVGITLPYSRTQEAEADEIGLMYMARAGYDPRQAIALWQNMERASGERPIEFLSTHPSPGSRIERLQALMPKALAEYRAAGGGTGR
jgi:predicted Zn-dependent protease